MYPVIETKSLFKTYRSDFGRKASEALRGVSLTVSQGEIQYSSSDDTGMTFKALVPIHLEDEKS